MHPEPQLKDPCQTHHNINVDGPGRPAREEDAVASGIPSDFDVEIDCNHLMDANTRVLEM